MINKLKLVQRILEGLKVNPDRLSLEWVSAAEAPRFVGVITKFTEGIRSIGPLGSSEGLDTQDLKIKLAAAKMALEGKRLRMVFARQAKYQKHEGTYREIPSDHKLHRDLDKALSEELASNGMRLYLDDKPREVDELAGLLDLSSEDVATHFEKLVKKGFVKSDRLIGGQ